MIPRGSHRRILAVGAAVAWTLGICQAFHYHRVPHTHGRSAALGSRCVRGELSPVAMKPLSKPSNRREAVRLHAAGPLVAVAEAVTQGINWGAISHNAASLAVLFGIVFAHETGHFLAAVMQGIKVKNFSIGFGPSLVSFKRNDIEYTIRAFPAGGFVSFPQHFEIDDKGEVTVFEDKDLLQNRPPLQQALVISSGVIANVLLAFSLLLGSVTTTGLPRPHFSEGPMVVRLLEKDCPAAVADVRAEDVIVAINGQKVEGDEGGLARAVSLITSSGPDSVELDVKRAGAVVHKSIRPKYTDGKAAIGVQMASHVDRVDVLKASNPVEAIKYSCDEFNTMLKEATNSIKKLTQSGMEGFTGPLGIVQVGADLAAVDNVALIKFAAFISVNLAVVNALPFPGLDGGAMIFVILEAVRGKRLSPKIEASINTFAVLLLAAMSFYLIQSDLTRGSPLTRLLNKGPPAPPPFLPPQ